MNLLFEFHKPIRDSEYDTRSLEEAKESRGRFLISEMDLGPDDPARVIITINPARQDEFFNLLNNTLEEAEAMNATIDVHYNFAEVESFDFKAVVLSLTGLQLSTLQDQAGGMIQSIDEDLLREVDETTSSLPEQITPYGVEMVQAPQLWDSGITGKNVRVCVIDSGINAKHPDFDRKRLNGSKLIGPWKRDRCGHGTHVSGTIGATNNEHGVVGVAHESNIFSVKVFNRKCAGAYSSTIISAALHCLFHDAKIINMSLGGPAPSNLESSIYGTLYNDFGILIIAAAGNAGDASYSYPASYPSVMSVAAVDSNGIKAPFSQFNNAVDISAPGVDVQSVKTDSGGTSIATMSGTSMAAPHVSGVAALLYQAFPKAGAKRIRAAMEKTANDKGDAGRDDEYGWGIVQAQAAYDCLANNCV
jgi:serine protease